MDWRAPFLIPLLLLIAARVTAWMHLPIASEDAYITFRYARNLAAGNGLVYNPGEFVMGFTSPLWAVWNAIGFKLLGDPVLWSRATTLAGDGLTLLLMGWLFHRHLSAASAWCFTFFFAAWPYFSAVAVSGMENSMMFTLIALSAALVERKSIMAGPTLAALALVRPEGVACAALLAIGGSWRDRFIALGLAGLGWGALAATYGSLIPQSVAAKASIYGTPGPWAGRHWWEWIMPMALGRWPVTGEGNMLLPLNALLAPAAVVGAITLWAKRGTALARAIAACLGVWLGYAVLGVAFFYWYMVVPLAGIAALAAAGLPRIVRGRAVFVAIVMITLGTWSIGRVLYVGRTQNEFYSFGDVANYLAANATPGQKVMLEPIGIVGYRNGLYVIDEVGLVSPRVAERRLQGAGWYSDIVTTERPDWLVIRASVLQGTGSFAGAGAPFRSGAERDSLFARYERVHVADEGRSNLLIQRRVR